MDPPKTSLAFAFTKKKEPSTKILQKSAVVLTDDSKEEEETPDFVTAIDEKEIKSTKPVEEKKELIIPLIQNNNWRLEQLKNKRMDETSKADVKQELVETDSKSTSTELGQVEESLEEKARRELVSEARNFSEEWEERGTKESNRVIPIFVANRAPGGFEEDDNFDVSARAENPRMEDYEKVPVEEFGLAMLRGMGFKPEDAKKVEPVEVKIRPKGLGLGAELPNSSSSSRNSKSSSSSKEVLELKRGACIFMLAGKHKGLYGTIEGFDEDMTQCDVHLVIPNMISSVPVAFVKLVTREEFKKESKVLNRNSYDQCKEKTGRKEDDEKHHRDHRHREHRHRSSRERDRSKSNERVHSSKTENRHRDDRREHRDRSKEHSEHNRSHSTSQNDDSKLPPYLWLSPGLRIRIIDRNYKGGKFYKEKVDVIDVPRPGCCSVLTFDRKRLDDLTYRMVETVVPKEDNSSIIIVKGEHFGKRGIILSREKTTHQAIIQLLNEPDTIVKLPFDDICQFAGTG